MLVLALARKTKVPALLCALLVVLPAAASSQTITAQWDPSPASDAVTGYQVCIGTASVSCDIALASAGVSQTSYTFSPPGGVMVYVAVRAVSAGGVSPYSSEARFAIPAISPLPSRSNPVGTAIAPFSVPVSDPDGSALSFVHTGLPLGLTLDHSTGRIAGTPMSVGTYRVVIYASDNLATVSRSFTWTVTDGGEPSGGDAGGGSFSSGTSGPSVDSVTPSSGSGLTQTFVLRYSDPAGASNLDGVWAYFTRTYSTGSGQSCLVRYDRASDSILLQNDAATGWTAGRLGAAGTLGNTQCVVELAGSSVSWSGTTLTMSLKMQFSTQYGGPLTIYMFASNRSREITGWKPRGSWVVVDSTTSSSSTSSGSTSSGSTTSTPTTSTSTTSTSTTTGSTSSSTSGPSVDSVTPSSGSGLAQTFVLRYSDPAGTPNLDGVWAYFTRTYSTGSGQSCLVRYDRASDSILLQNDAASGWTAARLGAAGTLGNTQCAVELGGSSVSLSGTTLTMSLRMQFSTQYGGPLTVYMFASNRSREITGWKPRGSWTVP